MLRLRVVMMMRSRVGMLGSTMRLAGDEAEMQNQRSRCKRDGLA